jgi:CheY-like chemotaxis protein
MEAIGRLAGGVAHDFNNLLTVIHGSCEMLDAHPACPPELAELLDMIRGAAERGSALTRQLLAFSRRQVLLPRPVQLNDLLTNLEKLLRRLIGENVALTTDLAADLGCTLADPGQLEQVVMNLVVNARDAMPGGGTIALTTRNVDLPGAAGPAPGVMLAVADTGHGMDEDTRRHIFEPFFTTKEPGKGTGLGLATVYGIVQQSGGFLRVDSRVGRGTTFQVFLPRAAAAGAATEAPRPRAERGGAGETVLVVEDEDPLRAMVREILRRDNYEVLEARDGADALRVWEQAGGPVDLLLTDVAMPRMSGHDLADRLSRAAPGLKILYMSGYPRDVPYQQSLAEAGRPFLQKPFTAALLTATVREVLDRRA